MKLDSPGRLRPWGLPIFLAYLLCVLVASPAQSATATDFDLDDYAGRVVVLDFWASWCVPCRRSFPWLNAMHEKYAHDGLVIVGVNLDLERTEAERFLAEFPASFRIVYDDKQALARQFDLIAMPSTYLIGRDGKVFDQHAGFKVREQAEYEAAIVSALSQAGTENE